MSLAGDFALLCRCCALCPEDRGLKTEDRTKDRGLRLSRGLTVLLSAASSPRGSLLHATPRRSIDPNRFGKDDKVASLSPLDKLRLDLDAAWEHGCTLSKDRHSGRALSPGMGRIMRAQGRWSEGFCHVDELDLISERRGLFGANVYLRVPGGGVEGKGGEGSGLVGEQRGGQEGGGGEGGGRGGGGAGGAGGIEEEARTTPATPPIVNGGGVEIFPVSVRSRWDFYRNAYTLSNLLSQDEEGQRRLRAALPDPIYVEPEAGDLLILCSQRPHAVVGFDAGERVSVQTFLTHTRGGAIKMDC